MAVEFDPKQKVCIVRASVFTLSYCIGHWPKFQIISAINFQNFRFSRKSLFSPTSHLFLGSYYLYNHFHLSWPFSSVHSGGEKDWHPRFFHSVKTSHERLCILSEELLKAGQHEDRLFRPHVTSDGHLCVASSLIPTDSCTSPCLPCC